MTTTAQSLFELTKYLDAAIKDTVAIYEHRGISSDAEIVTSTVRNFKVVFANNCLDLLKPVKDNRPKRHVEMSDHWDDLEVTDE